MKADEKEKESQKKNGIEVLAFIWIGTVDATEPSDLTYANILCQRDRVSHYVIPIILISCSNVEILCVVHTSKSHRRSFSISIYPSPGSSLPTLQFTSSLFFCCLRSACTKWYDYGNGGSAAMQRTHTVSKRNELTTNKRLTDRSAFIQIEWNVLIGCWR